MAAPRNRTLGLQPADVARLQPLLQPPPTGVLAAVAPDTFYHADALAVLPLLPDACADLVFLDPPYNLSKTYGEARFNRRTAQAYGDWVALWLPQVVRCLRPGGSLYFCADWRSSAVVQTLLEAHLTLQNRITFEREKGRAARHNWKNCQEDIWFATKGADYYFDAQAVRMQRRVVAPYRNAQGEARDWQPDAQGQPYRRTAASNLWTDITLPFWSMPENTPHPTQKPEKLLAKVLLASSPPGALVLDPFAGVGTTAVVARKLGRHFLCIEQQASYALLALRRLELAAEQPGIQGYADGVFWERNSQPRAQ